MSDLSLPLCRSVQEAVERLKARFELTPWDQVDANSEAINHMTAQLAAGFTAYFAPAEVAERFEIPADYLCFLQECNGGYERGQEYGVYLHNTALVVSNTQYLCDVMAEVRPATAGMWIEIAHYSDKHDMFLCCDRRLSLFGIVVDGDDDHPWIPDGFINSFITSENAAPDNSLFDANFLQYLHSLA